MSIFIFFGFFLKPKYFWDLVWVWNMVSLGLGWGLVPKKPSSKPQPKKTQTKSSDMIRSYQIIKLILIFTEMTDRSGKIFLLSEFFRACSKIKSAQWGFSFTKSTIHFLKQRCLYFNYMTLTV